MPKTKQLEKCKHPNSRKTKALAKQIKKQSKRDKSKLVGNIKLNLLGEKVLWFQQNLDPECKKCSPRDVEVLVSNYLARFNEELEQIRLKHSIGDRKNRQHASREDIIKLTVKREIEEYNTCGIEIPNILDPVQFDLLKTWNGELRYLQNFKLRRFSKKILDEEAILGNKKISVNNKKMCTDISENVEECL
ncbi:translation machinery-associated protein 16 homolog [Anoplophora glabripennis]|nr:translation machinery-associated protein 16 homolog [Anoplophora glabripennis]